MMSRPLASVKTSKYSHLLLAVYCGKKKRSESGTQVSISTTLKLRFSPLSIHKPVNLNEKAEPREGEITQNSGETRPAKASIDLVTGGQLEVHVLESPKKVELKQTLEALEPDIVYFLGERISGTEDIGPLELKDLNLSTADDLVSLFGERLPQLVCLEVNGAGKFGDALHNKGVPYVIFWKGALTALWATHFRQALVAVLKSQIWSACQLAIASFRFYYGTWKLQGFADGPSKTVAPVLLGDAPEILLETPRIKDSFEADGSPSMLLKIQIYDEEIDLPLLITADTRGQDNSIFGPLEDGLNALLFMEVIGMRLLHRVSATSAPSNIPPPARGVVTMRCDLCTSSSARISLLVAGNAQTCLDDQLLEYSIKKELLGNTKFVSSSMTNAKSAVADVRKSASVACGASVMEVRFRSTTWAVQVLRQLAPEISFRSLVALGIAGVQGFPVASFQKDDADRFLALKPSSSRGTELERDNNATYVSHIPSWLSPVLPSRKRQRIDSYGSFCHKSACDEDSVSSDVGKDVSTSETPGRPWAPKYNYIAAMKPVPHVHQNRDMPYAGAVLAGAHNTWSMKISLPNGTSGRIPRLNASTGSHNSTNSGMPISNRGQSIRVPSPAQMLSLNPVPMKKHACNRRPMHECSEEEFKKDIMQFLISRGHGRLVPSTDVETFPDAVLNGKRLDVYNLYKEVVSRGGFHVGNGINWKGQVFSKMRNHTILNKMTGVGNTLKKHYETYLLEYELAHDDVDGECCILCHSTAGDWVNCGICGEWAHYGCDKRNGLGAFKEYAKTDGLEYICPRCSVSNGRSASGRKKSKPPANGYSHQQNPT